MARYALINNTNSKVENLIVVENINDFDVPQGFSLIKSDTANINDDYYNGDFVTPPPPLPTKNELINYASDRRWYKEVKGITVAGILIATDDRSKQMIMGARIAADTNPEFITQWVAKDGSIYNIDAQTIIAISNAVLEHVANCFAVYSTIKQQIDDGTITTYESIDSSFTVI